MQQIAFQPAATSRSFIQMPEAVRPVAPFQVPLNLSAEEIRELVRDILG